MPQNRIAPPPGYTLDTPATGASQSATQPQTSTIAPPPGYTLDSPGASRTIDYDAIQAQQKAQLPGQPVPNLRDPNVIAQGAQDFVTGIGKGFLQTTSGIGEAIHAIPVVGPALIPEDGLRAEEKLAETHGIMQGAGALTEAALEWAAGDAALSGLAKLTKVPAAILKLAKENPTLARILVSTSIGGTQGGVKGAAEGDAKGGALGGAIGGGVGQGIAEAAPILARILGIGGLTAEQALTKAARPNLSDVRSGGIQGWYDKLRLAAPRLVEANQHMKIKTVGDFVDMTHASANALWQREIEPQITRHAAEEFSAQPIAARIRSAVTRPMEKYDPKGTAELREFATQFDGKMTVQEAAEDLQYLNAQLKGFYKMSPEARSAAGKTDAFLEKLESAADGIRDALYSYLEAAGEATPRELRQQYGALKDIERVFGKRATVADRQAPMNLTQILGATEAAAALAAGHPAVAAAGAIPFITKQRNSPESLIRQGMAGFRDEIAPRGYRIAQRGAEGAFTGAQAGRLVSFRSSDGYIYDMSPDKIEAAKRVDPQGTVLPDPPQPGLPQGRKE